MIRFPAGFDGEVRIKRYQDFYQPGNGVAAIAPALFGVGTPAGNILGSEPSGFAVDFTSNPTQALIRNTASPANYFGDPFSANGGPLVFSRASNGTYFDENGVLQTATTNVPRIDHHPVTGQKRGLLIEEERTNVCLHSQNLTDASWFTAAASVSASGTAPDGVSTAFLMAGDGTSASHRLVTVISPFGANRAVSFFAKANTNNFIQYYSDSNNNDWANFDLALGVTGSKGATTGATTITALKNGWYRCTAITGSASSTNIGFSLIDAANAPRQQSNTLSTSVYLWGVQGESGTYATSYFPTTSSPGIRRADISTTPIAAIPYNASSGTLIAAGIRNIVAKASVIAEIGDGSINNLLELYGANNTATGGWYVGSGGSQQASLTVANTFPNLTAGKVAGVYAQNDFQMAGNGVLATQDTTGVVPVSPTNLYIGKYGGDNNSQWNGWVSQIVYIPRRIPDVELQSRTK